MNGIELAEFIKKFPSICDNFAGIYSINTLPKILKRNHFLFCNTDFNFEPGSHWICFLRQNKSSVECFDSLGLNFDKQDLIKTYCSYKNVKFNETVFQSPNSKTCGLFVLYYVINRMHNLDLSFTDFLKDYFQNDLNKNEEIVNEFFNSF